MSKDPLLGMYVLVLEVPLLGRLDTIIVYSVSLEYWFFQTPWGPISVTLIPPSNFVYT